MLLRFFRSMFSRARQAEDAPVGEEVGSPSSDRPSPPVVVFPAPYGPAYRAAPTPLPGVQGMVQNVEDPTVQKLAMGVLRTGDVFQRKLITEEQADASLLEGIDPASGTMMDAVHLGRLYPPQRRVSYFHSLEAEIWMLSQALKTQRFQLLVEAVQREASQIGSADQREPLWLYRDRITIPLMDISEGRDPNFFMSSRCVLDNGSRGGLVRSDDLIDGRLVVELDAYLENGCASLNITSMYPLPSPDFGDS